MANEILIPQRTSDGRIVDVELTPADDTFLAFEPGSKRPVLRPFVDLVGASTITAGTGIAPSAETSAGEKGQRIYDTNQPGYIYECVVTGAEGFALWVRYIVLTFPDSGGAGSAPQTPTSMGLLGTRIYDPLQPGYIYECVIGGAEGEARWVRYQVNTF